MFTASKKYIASIVTIAILITIAFYQMANATNINLLFGPYKDVEYVDVTTVRIIGKHEDNFLDHKKIKEGILTNLKDKLFKKYRLVDISTLSTEDKWKLDQKKIFLQHPAVYYKRISGDGDYALSMVVTSIRQEPKANLGFKNMRSPIPLILNTSEDASQIVVDSLTNRIMDEMLIVICANRKELEPTCSERFNNPHMNMNRWEPYNLKVNK